MKTIVKKCIDDCVEKIKEINDQELNGILNQIKKEVNEEEYENILYHSVKVNLAQLIPYDFNNALMLDLLCQYLKNVLDELPQDKKSYIYSCQLENNQATRLIEVPNLISYDELASLVLASFQAHGQGEYQIQKEGEVQHQLQEKITITYENEDIYKIHFTCLEEKTNDFIFDYDDVKIIEKNGDGIKEELNEGFDIFEEDDLFDQYMIFDMNYQETHS